MLINGLVFLMELLVLMKLLVMVLMVIMVGLKKQALKRRVHGQEAQAKMAATATTSQAQLELLEPPVAIQERPVATQERQAEALKELRGLEALGLQSRSTSLA